MIIYLNITKKFHEKLIKTYEFVSTKNVKIHI